MIQLDDVGKTFRVPPGPGRKARAVEALRAVTLSLDPGQIVGVVGPNGAGKTTLFGLLLGFLEPTTGNALIDGQDPRAFIRRNGANYLPERFQLPRDWTIGTALQALLGLDQSSVAADDLLATYELHNYATAKAFTLSRGTMQRVGIAQAFAQPRKLMVLDEPTEGLDPFWRLRFRESVRALRSPDRLVLIATHDLVEIERIADRILILRDGTIAENVMVTAPTETADYMLVLATPHESVATLFGNVRPGTNNSYLVTVENAADLNARLAALIDAGATIVSVNPTLELEKRVTGGEAN